MERVRGGPGADPLPPFPREHIPFPTALGPVSPPPVPRLALLCALAALAGCSKAPQPPPPPPDPPAPKWVGVRPQGFPIELWVPESWHRDVQRIQPGPGFLVRGPEEEGFRPNVQVYWSDGPRDLEDAIADLKSKLRNPVRPQEIAAEGAGTVAGMPARYLVYDSLESRGEFRTMDWYFAGERGHGLLRFTTLRRLFLEHQALFDEIVRRVRFAP